MSAGAAFYNNFGTEKQIIRIKNYSISFVLYKKDMSTTNGESGPHAEVILFLVHLLKFDIK